VRVVGAEGEHGDLRTERGDHVLDAGEPVVEAGLAQAGREPAFDSQDVDLLPGSGRAFERVAGHLGE
jgi:hypothetical protein